MNVFDYVFFYQTMKGKYGVVRADNIVEAAERINDSYSEDECDKLICLNDLDNDYGVIETTNLFMKGRM